MQPDNVIPIRGTKGKVIEQPPLATFRIGAVEMAVAVMMGASRRQLEAIIAAGIERLDELDGDADLEAHGDEADGSGLEDEFGTIPVMYGAGCPVADPGELEDHGGEGEWLVDQRVGMGGSFMATFQVD